MAFKSGLHLLVSAHEVPFFWHLKTGTFGKKNEGVSTSWAKLFNSCFMSLLFMTMLIVMIHRILFVVVPRFWEIVESFLALSE